MFLFCESGAYVNSWIRLSTLHMIFLRMVYSDCVRVRVYLVNSTTHDLNKNDVL